MSTIPTMNDRLTDSNKTYSLIEAIDYMREMDSLPTSNVTIKWYDVNTNKQVIIGYNDQPSKPF